MRGLRVKQLELLPGTNEARSWKLKPAPRQDEERFMRQLQAAAVLLGFATIHLPTYHKNSFWVTCGRCGARVLATCRKPINGEYAGFPDILFISAGIECKRDRNARGDPFEPSPLQTATHERLRRAGVPCLVVSPGNLSEAITFLKTIKRKDLS